MRTFDTGATRDSDDGKLDYEGFLVPPVLRRFAEYMHKNRIMSDGSLRASDNWQKGIPTEQYMKSLFRHFMATWEQHRKYHRSGVVADAAATEEMLDDLCGVLFNAMGYMHEILSARERDEWWL